RVQGHEDTNSSTGSVSSQVPLAGQVIDERDDAGLNRQLLAIAGLELALTLNGRDKLSPRARVPDRLVTAGQNTNFDPLTAEQPGVASLNLPLQAFHAARAIGLRE